MSDGLKRKAWSVVLAGTGINLALGILYTWSIFKGEIAKEGSGFGWDTDRLNDPYALCCLVFAFAMILAGRVQDRFGPRITAFLGGILVALGFVWISFSKEYVVWNLGFGLLTGTGIGFGYSAATPPGLKWFPSWKTGMVAGIVVSGFGLASVYIAPLATYLLGQWGLQSTMLFFGVAFAIVLSLLSLLLVNPVAGYDPRTVFGQPVGAVAGRKAAAAQADVRPREMLATPRFWLLWTTYAIGAGAGLMVISSVAGMAKKSMGEAAFVAVALFAVGNAAGRIVAGMLSDRIGRAQTLFIMLLSQAVLMFVAIPLVGDVTTAGVVLVLLATLIGFNYGTNLSLFPSVCKDSYGLKSFGMNYGLLFTAWGVGGFLLSRLSQMFVDSAVVSARAAEEAGRAAEAADLLAGMYTSSFATAGILLVVAALLTLTLRRPVKLPATRQERAPEGATRRELFREPTL